MYTQCPDCATVFRVTAEALRAAQGDVRCGVCSTTFNALENLSEQAFKAATEDEAPSPDDSMTVEELPGNENIELSAPIELVACRTRRSLHRPTPTHAGASPRPRTTRRRPWNFMATPRTSTDCSSSRIPRSRISTRAQVAANLAVGGAAIDLDSTDEHPILVLEESDDPAPGETIVLETPQPESHAGRPAATPRAAPCAPPVHQPGTRRRAS